MKKAKFSAAVLVLAAAVFVFAACASSNPFVGTWKYTEGGVSNVLQINDDNTCVQTSYLNDQEQFTDQGTWTINKEKTLLTVTFAGTEEYEGELLFMIKDDSLICLLPAYEFKKQ